MSQSSENPLVRAHLDVVERLWTYPVLDGCSGRWPEPQEATVMVAESRCGAVVKRWGEVLADGSRIMALDSSSPMLDEARKHLGGSGDHQVFFVKQQVRSLSYADGVFDAAACIHGLVSTRQVHEGLAEMTRVVSPGSQVLLVVPVVGSFPELYDLLVEGLKVHGMDEVIPRFRETNQQLMTPARLHEIAEEVGLSDPTMEALEWSVAFDGGREYVYSPLVRETFFPHWLGAIRAEDRDRVLSHASKALDTYWGGESIEAPVVAMLLVGRKGRDES